MKVSAILGFICVSVLGALAQTVDINVVGASSVAAGGPDINVVGATSVPASASAAVGVVPDVSVVGGHSIAATNTVNGAPEVSVIGSWTMSDAASPTQTVCYQVVESGGASSTVSAQPTIVNGLVPAGYSCYQVYSQGGGTMWSPLAQAAPNSSNKAITIALPIVVSLVGLLALVGAFFTYKRYRARRAAAADKHAWVNRPGGWAKDGANAETASTAKY